MKRIALLALMASLMCGPAIAQDPHAGHKPVPPAAPARPAVPAQPGASRPTSNDAHSDHSHQETPRAPSSTAADPHTGHDMPVPTNDAHAGHAMPPGRDDGGEQSQTAAALSAGETPPPLVIRDNAADRVYGASAMSRARDILNDEHGGAILSKVMGNILEYTSASDGSGYRWDIDGWYGGDLHRAVFKTEGEGLSRTELETAEVQALYSRAVGRYTDIQAGVRYDLEPDDRAYAAVAVETLFPYWFDVEAAVFLSDRGDAFARFEGSYDARLTQRVILQPTAEIEFAAQDVPDSEVGAGLSTVELGLRLRYDIRREFAPYIGMNFERSFGKTADFAREAGEDVEETTVVVGLRAWF
jgi:copper resistance protein B